MDLPLGKISASIEAIVVRVGEQGAAEQDIKGMAMLLEMLQGPSSAPRDALKALEARVGMLEAAAHIGRGASGMPRMAT